MVSKPGTLQVTMFGSFSLTHCDGAKTYSITDQTSSSKRLWTFLQYLIHHHSGAVTQDTVIDLLWKDAETDDPANTLKTLLHRARKSLESIGFADAKQVLIYRRGSYSWSEDLHFVLDTEEFERLYALGTTQPKKRLENLLAAIKLYAGVFLPKSSQEPWVMSLRMYYHTLYLQMCLEAAALLEAEARHIEIIDLCRRALDLEPYEEEIHLLLMKALSASGAQSAAIAHYNYVTQLFMDQLGVAPSEQLTAFYRDLVKSTKSVELDLRIIQNNLIEAETPSGPYYCEFAIFQDIYRLEARTTERSGQVIQLAMLSVLPQTGRELSQKQSIQAMERLKDVINATLRRGDAFTRFSGTQYLLLLPHANYENGGMVLNRLISRFKRAYPGSQVRLQYSILPLMPSG